MISKHTLERELFFFLRNLLPSYNSVRKRSRLHFRYYRGIRLEGYKKTRTPEQAFKSRFERKPFRIRKTYGIHSTWHLVNGNKKKRNLLANTVLTTNYSSRKSGVGRKITSTCILGTYNEIIRPGCTCLLCLLTPSTQHLGSVNRCKVLEEMNNHRLLKRDWNHAVSLILL